MSNERSASSALLHLVLSLVVLLSALFFKTPIRRHHAISLGLSYTGIALVFAANLQIASDPADTRRVMPRIGHTLPSAGTWNPGSSSTPPRICVAAAYSVKYVTKNRKPMRLATRYWPRGAGFDRYAFDAASSFSGVTLSGSMRTIR